MPDRLANKKAVVTGASRGIGRAIAIALAKEGAAVACLATKLENTQAVIEEIHGFGAQAYGFACRVEDANEVKRTFVEIKQTMGNVDLLVNNAGISKPVPLLEMSEENWDLHMDVNAKSVFLCSQAAIQQMKDSAVGGSVINIGSIVGENAIPQTLGYCASKATINHMTRVMAVECAKYKVRVNCVAPGYVRTELIDDLVADGKLAVTAIEKRTPQRRMGELDEISQAVVFVASEDASFMTGSVLTVDGGWSAYGYL
ncbi:MAG: SDR family NAD(P)-dependent oxidoreductase [Gammaproteobacteria bacterium]